MRPHSPSVFVKDGYTLNPPSIPPPSHCQRPDINKVGPYAFCQPLLSMIFHLKVLANRSF